MIRRRVRVVLLLMPAVFSGCATSVTEKTSSPAERGNVATALTAPSGAQTPRQLLETMADADHDANQEVLVRCIHAEGEWTKVAALTAQASVAKGELRSNIERRFGSDGWRAFCKGGGGDDSLGEITFVTLDRTWAEASRIDEGGDEATVKAPDGAPMVLRRYAGGWKWDIQGSYQQRFPSVAPNALANESARSLKATLNVDKGTARKATDHKQSITALRRFYFDELLKLAS